MTTHVPPKIAISARMVSTGDDPRIEWADGFSLAGDDAPGLLGLGLIDDVNILLDQATTSLVGSLVKHASGPGGGHEGPNSRFGPKVTYVSAKTGVALREVVVDFALKQSSGEERTTSAKVDVVLSAVSNKNVTVEYAVTGGTAVRGKNYDLKDGSLTFRPGETVKTLEIDIKANGMNEPDRTIEVSLRNPKGAVLGGTAVHTYTIMDSDPEPAVTFLTSGQQVKESAGSVTIGVELSNLSGWDVAVPLMMSGTARTPSNYRITPGPLVIKAGERRASVTVQVAANGLNEDDKTVVMSMGVPTHAVQGKVVTSTVTILNTDPEPAVTFTTASQQVKESAGSATIGVELSATFQGRT